MGLVLKRAGQGELLTISELYDILQPVTGVTYEALRKNIEGLERINMLERRRSGRETTIVPLQRGYDWFKPES